MPVRPLLYGVVAVVASVGFAAQCTTKTTSQPDPAPTITAEPPAPAPSAQDPAACDQACAAAQGKCKSHAPKSVEHCLGKCRDSAGLAAPSLDCLAVTYTCDEECP